MDDTYIKHIKAFQFLIVLFTIITLALTIRAFITGSIFEAIILTLATTAHICSFSMNMNCLRKFQKKKNLLNNAIFLGKDYGKV
jgi:hypothetical protein